MRLGNFRMQDNSFKVGIFGTENLNTKDKKFSCAQNSIQKMRKNFDMRKFMGG